MTDAATQEPPPRRYHNFSLEALHQELEDSKATKAACVTLEKEIEAELEARFGAQLAAEREKTERKTAHQDDGPFRVKAEAGEKIEWNSGILMQVANTLTWDQTKALFKIEFSVPAAQYKGLIANPELKARIDAARTVTPKPVKYSLERKA